MAGEAVVFDNSPLAQYLKGLQQDGGGSLADELSFTPAPTAAASTLRQRPIVSQLPDASLEAKNTETTKDTVPTTRLTLPRKLLKQLAASRDDTFQQLSRVLRETYVTLALSVVLSAATGAMLFLVEWTLYWEVAHLVTMAAPALILGMLADGDDFVLGHGARRVLPGLLLYLATRWMLHGSHYIALLSLEVAAFLSLIGVRNVWGLHLLCRRQARNIFAYDLIKSSLDTLDRLFVEGLTAIHNAELASRGFRFSGPAPPIARIELQPANRQPRRALALRTSLVTAAAAVLAALNVAASTLAGEGGAVEGVDVTDTSLVNLRHARRVLEEQRARLQAALEGSPAGRSGTAQLWAVAPALDPCVRAVRSAVDGVQRALAAHEAAALETAVGLGEQDVDTQRYLANIAEIGKLAQTLAARVAICQEELRTVTAHARSGDAASVGADDDLQTPAAAATRLQQLHAAAGLDLSTALDVWRRTGVDLGRVVSRATGQPAHDLSRPTVEGDGATAAAPPAPLPPVPLPDLEPERLRVYEAYTGPEDASDSGDSDARSDSDGNGPPRRSKLSRAERIAKREEELEAERRRRANGDLYQQQRVMAELASVLTAREPAAVLPEPTRVE